MLNAVFQGIFNRFPVRNVEDDALQRFHFSVLVKDALAHLDDPFFLSRCGYNLIFVFEGDLVSKHFIPAIPQNFMIFG